MDIRAILIFPFQSENVFSNKIYFHCKLKWNQETDFDCFRFRECKIYTKTC